MKLSTFISLTLVLGCTALQPRQQAPSFTGTAVIGEKFEEVTLSQYLGKWVVLLFYPFDFTFVCPTELISFSDRHSEFEKLGAQVLGISVDSQFVHLAWVRTARQEGGLEKMNFPLIADVSKKISSDYGVLVTDPADDLYSADLRGLFIINPLGKISVIQINDAPVGRSVDETLRLIQAFQYVEEHGEVCPANWQPGDLTIKPDPDDAKEYFKAANKV